jgi:hypothetical protein
MMILYLSLSSKLTALPLHIKDYHYATPTPNLYLISSLLHLYLISSLSHLISTSSHLYLISSLLHLISTSSHLYLISISISPLLHLISSLSHLYLISSHLYLISTSSLSHDSTTACSLSCLTRPSPPAASLSMINSLPLSLNCNRWLRGDLSSGRGR